jgi:hypothetical protein
MFNSNEVFSNHHLFKSGEYIGWIDVSSLMLTLRTLNKVKYSENYCIKKTETKKAPLKQSTIAYYQKFGVCPRPIVVTTKDFCLDGRHRIHYNRRNKNYNIHAYVVPHKEINQFTNKS